jgi:hypothetical protein
MTNGYIKLPQPAPMPDNITRLRQLSDEEWKSYIFFFLLKYFGEVDRKEVFTLIKNEDKKEKSQIEKVIKKHIKNWLKNKCKDFGYKNFGFLLDREVGTEGEIEGSYDLKFQHSYWQKYFSFEAKNLGKSKSLSLSQSIDEYVYVKSKNDGGMYRYMTGKYAGEFNFGGMLGFVISDAQESITELLINKIKSVFNDNLIGDKIVRNSIFDNENTFDSIHSVANKSFKMHHIIMDFTQ